MRTTTSESPPSTRTVGDVEAFVAAVRPRLARLAWTLTRDEGQAQDLVQVTLVKVWRAWSRVEAPEAFARRVLVREFASARRRAWRGESPTERLPEAAGGDDAGWSDGPSLAPALARLPRAQRAVVVLRYLEDLSVADTAAALGVSTGTVKSHTARALAALRVAPDLAGLGPAQPKEPS